MPVEVYKFLLECSAALSQATMSVLIYSSPVQFVW